MQQKSIQQSAEIREFTETTLLNYVLGQMSKERETMPSQITEPKEKDE